MLRQHVGRGHEDSRCTSGDGLSLNRIVLMTIPAFNQIGGTRVIPGHGRISNESDVVEYEDMATILYGATTGAWTTTMFVNAVCRDEMRRKGGR